MTLDRDPAELVAEAVVAVRGALPPVGVTVPVEEVFRRAELPEGRAWGALAMLCCEGVARVRSGRDGRCVVWRVG